jgi:hypothetical protein|nr:SGNH hydrolase domain-containing protein [uncultured Emticicia sp.]
MSFSLSVKGKYHLIFSEITNNKEVFNMFNQLKKEGLVDEILRLHHQFFGGNKTIIFENNHLLYRDDDHLSYWGSMKVGRLFVKYMKNEN